MLTSSWESFNSIIAIPAPLPDLNPWRTLCIYRLARRRVLISASTTFHRVSNRPMPRVLVVPFGIRTRNSPTSSFGYLPHIPHVLYYV